MLLYSYKKKQSQSLRLDLYAGPQPMSEGHPISMVCSRSGVRLYALTPRAGPGLLCAAARFGFDVLKNLSLLEDLDFTPAASATTNFKDVVGIYMTIKTFFTFQRE